MTHRARPDCCDGCQYPTLHLNRNEHLYDSYTKVREVWLCVICEKTPNGKLARNPLDLVTATDLPLPQPTMHDVLKTLCFLGNALVGALMDQNRRARP